MPTETIKANIEAAYGDAVAIGRTTENTQGDLVFIQVREPGQGNIHVYFSATEKKGLDDTIEALIRARKEVFGTRP